jgi:hypothetical protein
VAVKAHRVDPRLHRVLAEQIPRVGKLEKIQTFPVLRSGMLDGVESKDDRNRPGNSAEIDPLFNLRAPPRDVGRERDRAWSNPRIRGNAAFLGEQALARSLLRMI